MNGSKKGVIYVCFGSLIEPENIKSIGEIIVKHLANRQERVLLKWNPDLLSNIPSNFLVRTWTPQADILSKYSICSKYSFTTYFLQNHPTDFSNFEFDMSCD